MGIRNPPPPEIIYGNDCPYCYTEGNTPSKIQAIVSGMEKNPDPIYEEYPPPPNGTWILSQDPNYPCTWNLQTRNWLLGFGHSISNSIFGILDEVFDTVFNGSHAGCFWSFSNTVTFPPGPYGGGSVIITPASTSNPMALIYNSGLDTRPTTLLENLTNPSGPQMYRGVNELDKSNYKLKLESE